MPRDRTEKGEPMWRVKCQDKGGQTMTISTGGVYKNHLHLCEVSCTLQPVQLVKFAQVGRLLATRLLHGPHAGSFHHRDQGEMKPQPAAAQLKP